MKASETTSTGSRSKSDKFAVNPHISLKTLWATTGVVFFALLFVYCSAEAQTPAPQTQNRIQQAYQNRSLTFVPNRGQSGQKDKFTARGHGYAVALQAGRAVLSLAAERPAAGKERKAPAAVDTITMDWLGAAPNAEITGVDPMQQKNSFFPTGDPKTWIANVPSYGRVNYAGIYPGVDLTFYGREGHLEYDLNLAPGADAGQIGIGLSGISSAETDRQGNLLLRAGDREMRFLKPVAYQESQNGGERQNIEVQYRLQKKVISGKTVETVSFVPGKYDRLRPLVIDPVLAYGGYVPSHNDFISAFTVDAHGNMYVAVDTYGLTGTVIEKLDPNGNLLFDVTLGAYCFPEGIAIDGSGNVYLAGGSGLSGTFPVTGNAYQQLDNTGTGGFLSVLSPDGAKLRYSTIISQGPAIALALDSKGGVYVAGQNTNGGNAGFGFVAKFNPELSGLASLIYSYSTTTFENENAIAVDSAGSAYLAGGSYAGEGVSASPGAFTYKGAYAANPGAVVTKIKPDGSGPAYRAYLGPGQANGIAVDGSGHAYVTGSVNAKDFPTTTGAYQTSYSAGFVSKLSADGGTLIYSTFLSGPSGANSHTDSLIPAFVPTRIKLRPACASQCSAYVAGYTFEIDLPLKDPIQNFGTVSPPESPLDPDAGGGQYFLIELDGAGQNTVYSTYVGGVFSGVFYNPRDPDNVVYFSAYPFIPELTVDGAGNVYLAMNAGGGSSGPQFESQLDFPATVQLPAGEESGPGFIAKIAPANASLVLAIPQDLYFSSGPVGYLQGPYSLVLRNLGSKPVNLQTPFTISASSYSETDDCGSVLPAGGACTINVSFLPPVTAGPPIATLTIDSDAPNAPTTIDMISQATIIFPPLPKLTYGAPPVHLKAIADSGLPVTYSVTGPATIYGSTLTITGAGGGYVVASQPGNSSYPPSSTMQYFAVVPAPLTITPANATIVSGQPIPGFTWTATGFVNGENPAVLFGTPVESTTATSLSHVGSYPIFIARGTLAAPNYSFSLGEGTLSIVGSGRASTAPPQIYPSTGDYLTPQTLIITDATPGAAIYYTTDGSIPTSASSRFKGPVLLDTSWTVSAIAVANGAASPVSAAGYNVNLSTTVEVNAGAGFSPGIDLSFNGAAQLGMGVQQSSTGVLQITGGVNDEANSAWLQSKVPVSNFTTDFTFQLTNAVADGFTFTIQNEGLNALGGAGGSLGYQGIGKSVSVKFDLHNNGGEGNNSTGIYLNGVSPIMPAINLTGTGIDLHSGHILEAHLVYDGSQLTLKLTDTVTHAVFTHAFPVDIPGTVGADSAYVGFTGGTGSHSAVQNILSWVYTTNRGSTNTAAAPAITPGDGVYTGPVTVAMADATPGAAIHYTKDGTKPGASSPLYRGPIVVNPDEIVNAVAIAAGHSTSAVTTASYQSPPTTEFSFVPGSFFSLSNTLSVQGSTALGFYLDEGSGGLPLTDGGADEVTSAWFRIKVPVSSFTTDFTFQLSGDADGFTFTIQNTFSNILGTAGGGLGSAGIKKSVSIKFDLHDNAGEGNNSTGIYRDGVPPTVPAVDLTGSGINLHSGDMMDAHLVYDGSAMALTLTDMVTNAAFTTTFPVNIPGTVGAGTAYVGFTGATGGGTAVQKILSWQFSH